jgi:acyl-CoA synthetase (AMP-forming)/AMP-acid ligase II
VPVGETGELLTRGYSVMKGYWNDPERTAEAIDAEGWMHTGDLATIDAQGYCNIVGRVKDMLIRGGENVYPREVEEFLFTHPECAVGAGLRGAGPQIRRGGVRLDRAAPRHRGGRGRDPRVLPRPDRALQDPALRARSSPRCR